VKNGNVFFKVNRMTTQFASIETSQPEWKHDAPIAPIVSSIIGAIAWLIFILLYALYWSQGFSLFQNIIVTIVSLAIAALLIGLMWIIWGTKYSRKWWK